MKPAHPARQKAVQNGEHYYHGAACYICGNTLRHTRNTNCVQCHDNGNRNESVQKQRREQFLQAMNGVNYDPPN